MAALIVAYAQDPTPTPPSGGIFPITNGRLMTPLDANSFKINNMPAPSGPDDAATKAYVDANSGGGPGGGGLASITGDNGSATGLTLTITGLSGGDPLTDPVFTLGSTLLLTHGGTGATTALGAKTNLSLDQVNNTSDANKPISTATQTALDLKADTTAVTSALGAFTGTSNIVTLGTIATGTWQGSTIANSYLPALNGISAPTGDLSLASHKIINLADPSNATDATNKQYVDAVANAGPPHAAANTATTANITLSGEQTIDGVATSASRVLVKNQTSASDNGIYVSAAGAWTRATDADTGPEVSGTVFVGGGSVNAGSTWGVTTPQPITIGATPVAYTLTGQGTVYSAGTGLTLSGSQFSLANMAATTLKGNKTAGSAAPTDLSVSETKTILALNNVENTALSSWAGSANITTLGTVTAGSFPSANLSPAPGVPGLAVLNSADSAVGNIRYPRINAANAGDTLTRAQVLSDIGAENALTFDSPLIRGAPNPANHVAIPRAANAPSPGPGTSGFLHADDFRDFTSKVPSSRTLQASAPLRIAGASGAPGSDLSANRTLDMPAATVSTSGYLSNTDFANFASGSAVTGLALATGSYNVVSQPNQPPNINRILLQTVTTPGLTINLPPVVNYPAGQYIEIVDPNGGAMANFGVTVAKAGSDTIDGAGSIPLPRGSTYARITSNGGNPGKWTSTFYYTNAIIDANDPNKKITFDVSGLASPAPSPNYIVRPSNAGDSVTVRPYTSNSGILRALSTTGVFSESSLSDILPSTSNNANKALFATGNASNPFEWRQVQLPSTTFTVLTEPTIDHPQWDFNNNKAILTLNANKTLGVTNANDGDSRTLEIRHANNASTYHVYLPSGHLTSGGTPGELTVTNSPNAIDLYGVVYEGTNQVFMWTPLMLNGVGTAVVAPVPEMLWWKMNEGSPNTTFTSGFTGGPTGTLTSATNTWGDAMTGNASLHHLILPGTANSVFASTSITYTTSVIGVSFWVYDTSYDSSTTNVKGVFQAGTAAGLRWGIFSDDTMGNMATPPGATGARIRFRISQSGSSTALLQYSGPAPSTSTWHNYVVVFDNNNRNSTVDSHGDIKVYLDGVRQTTGTPAGGDLGLNLDNDLKTLTGNFAPNTVTGGPASLNAMRNDDLRIFSREPTQGEINAIVAAGPQ